MPSMHSLPTYWSTVTYASATGRYELVSRAEVARAEVARAEAARAEVAKAEVAKAEVAKAAGLTAVAATDRHYFTCDLRSSMSLEVKQTEPKRIVPFAIPRPIGSDPFAHDLESLVTYIIFQDVICKHIFAFDV